MKKSRQAHAADRRPERRVSTLLSGVVSTLDGSAEYDCTIRDLSDSGARIAVSKRAILPDEFYLMHVKDRIAYRVKAAWRSEENIGVQFVSAIPLAGQAPLFLRKAWLRKAVG